jgi:hypothetical protein
MSLLRRLGVALVRALTPGASYRDPGPVRLLVQRRDALAHLQRLHFEHKRYDPDASDYNVIEQRVDWLETKQRLLANGYPVTDIHLPDLEESAGQVERREAAVEVERLLN